MVVQYTFTHEKYIEQHNGIRRTPQLISAFSSFDKEGKGGTDGDISMNFVNSNFGVGQYEYKFDICGSLYSKAFWASFVFGNHRKKSKFA